VVAWDFSGFLWDFSEKKLDQKSHNMMMNNEDDFEGYLSCLETDIGI
jgi:hypothetical protein